MLLLRCSLLMLLLALSSAIPKSRHPAGDIFAEERGTGGEVAGMSSRSVMQDAGGSSSANSLPSEDAAVKSRWTKDGIHFWTPDKKACQEACHSFFKEDEPKMECSRKVKMAVAMERARLAEVFRMMERERWMERQKWRREAQAMSMRPRRPNYGGPGMNYFYGPQRQLKYSSWPGGYDGHFMGPGHYFYGPPTPPPPFYMFGRADEEIKEASEAALATPDMEERAGFYRPELIEELKREKWVKNELQPDWNRCYTPDCRPSTTTKDRNNGINGLHY